MHSEKIIAEIPQRGFSLVWDCGAQALFTMTVNVKAESHSCNVAAE